MRKLPESADWVPEYFEFSFGLSDDGRDPRSEREPVLVDGRFLLRGSVDLVETRPGSQELRITDHKTGRNRTTPRTVIGGGGTLQPVLYGLVVEETLKRPVVAGRLFYCTAAGGFAEHVIPLIRRQPARWSRGARDRRSRDRARVPARRAGRARVRMV